jgi:tetraacyldisaccharide 4'-kinase
LTDFQGQILYAIAGIGHPQRFFSALKQQGLNIIEKPFADHYPFSEADFAELDPSKPLVMTAKDAVKCQKITKAAFAKERFANANWWVCPVTVVMDAAFETALLKKLHQDPRLSRNTAHES